MTHPAPTPSVKRLPRALTPEELAALLDVPRQARDRALIRVMAGCGLRVSEACNLRLEDITWSDTPVLRFIGKRRKERVVPMNEEVQDALRAWLEIRGANGSPYVFCNLKKRGQYARGTGRLSRKTVWFTLRRYAFKAGLRHIHPHMLRHTFGTSLADEGIPIERIKDLMGHTDISSSSIYIQVSASQKRIAVEKLDRRPWLLRWISHQRNRTFRFFTGLKPRPFAGKLQTVGRRTEGRRLEQNLSRGIDTLLIGPTGAGKSHLLGLLEGERVLRLPSLSPARQSVIALAEALYSRGVLKTDLPKEGEGAAEDLDDDSDEEGVGEVVKGEISPDTGDGGEVKKGQEPSEGKGGGEVDNGKKEDEATPSPAPAGDFEAFRKQHARTTVRGWVEMITASIPPHEWTLVIDDLSDLSASTARLIDPLNKRFTIFAAAAEIKKAYEKHFWKFERVEVGNLPRREAAELVRQAASGADIEDYRLFETHVLQQSAGNPRAILEIVDRLRKEPAITRAAVRDVAHVGARGKLDLTPALLLVVAVFMACRYVARGVDSFDGYMLAGVGSAGFMVLRFFLGRMRR